MFIRLISQFSSEKKVLFRFSFPEKSKVSLKIYDVTGRLVSVLISGNYIAEFYKIPFRPRSKGVYFYRIKSSYKKGKGTEKFLGF